LVRIPDTGQDRLTPLLEALAVLFDLFAQGLGSPKTIAGCDRQFLHPRTVIVPLLDAEGRSDVEGTLPAGRDVTRRRFGLLLAARTRARLDREPKPGGPISPKIHSPIEQQGAHIIWQQFGGSILERLAVLLEPSEVSDQRRHDGAAGAKHQLLVS